jgi:hypothetical protein
MSVKCSMARFAQRAIISVVGGLLWLTANSPPTYGGAASRNKSVSVSRPASAMTDLSGRRRYRRRWPSLVVTPAVSVVGGGVATTELASRYGYNIPYFGYYGGPVYYGGPYYNRPFYDGVSSSYFRTHPIVEW